MNFKEAVSVLVKEVMPHISDEDLDDMFEKHNPLDLLSQISIRIGAGHVKNQEAISEIKRQADYLITKGCLREEV